MAKQTGDYKITDTYDDVAYYLMDGEYYARVKSSLKGTRVKKDPCFWRTMQSAHRLGRGSQLASKVYRSLPRQEQVYALFKELKRMAVLAIKEGKEEVEVMTLLQQRVARKRVLICAPANRLHGVPARQFKTSRLVVQNTMPRTKKLFGSRARSKPGAMRPESRLAVNATRLLIFSLHAVFDRRKANDLGKHAGKIIGVFYAQPKGDLVDAQIGEQ